MSLPELNWVKGEIEFLTYMKYSFILVFVFLTFYYIFTKKFIESIKNTEIVYKNERKTIVSEVDNLKAIIDSPKSEFYGELSKILREAVSIKFKKDIFPKTLLEVEKTDFPEEYKGIFRKIYGLEFKELDEDSKAFRENLISDILKLIT